jgi:DHA1 family bicyclomycin/chloramphenicol resistance-like MFS transporter
MDGSTPIAQMAPHIATPDRHAGMGFREFVGLVAAMNAMMALGIDTMLPALPAIGRSMGVVDENALQWIVTSYVLGFGVATIFYGPISDRYGRKPLMLGGMVSYAICCVCIIFAPSFAVLLTLRALQGGAVAAVRVVMTSMVRDCYEGRQMARVMSLAMIIFLAVPILAPSIGQVIMFVFPWQGLFAVLAGFATIVFLWVWLRLPETLHPDYRRPIEVATVLSGMRTALTNRQACGYMIVQAIIQGALLGFIASIQEVFAVIFHAPKLMPPVFAAIAGSMAIASLLNSRLVERLGTRRIGHTAIVGLAVTQALHLLVALAGLETIWTFAIFQSLALFCFGLAMGNFSAIAMEPLASLAGTAASVQGFVMMVGGSLIGTAIGQSFDGTTVPMAAGFAIAGLCAIGVILVTERGRMFHPQMGA